MVAGPQKIGEHYIGEGVHTMVMNPGRNYPDVNRDRMGGTNNMWSYPEYLGPGPITAHIPQKEETEKDIEAGKKGLENTAKKLEKVAKAAENEEAAAKKESLVQKASQEINSTPWKLQSVAGENKLGEHYIGESVHTASMWSGDSHPEEHRDRMKNTNNMWSYPEHLDSHGPVKAHIDMTKTDEAKEKEKEAKLSLV